MAVHAIEWRICQCLGRPVRMKLRPSYGPFSNVKGLHDIRAYFREVYIHIVFHP